MKDISPERLSPELDRFLREHGEVAVDVLGANDLIAVVACGRRGWDLPSVEHSYVAVPGTSEPPCCGQAKDACADDDDWG